MFLIRITFWLALVIAFIPANPADLDPGQKVVTTSQTLGALKNTASDFANFCERNPGSCETGREIVRQFGAKARNGAAFVANFFDDSSPAGPDAVQTGSIE